MLRGSRFDAGILESCDGSTITGGRSVVDFRNRLTHEYPMVDDELV